jgi:hypothetical protein
LIKEKGQYLCANSTKDALRLAQHVPSYIGKRKMERSKPQMTHGRDCVITCVCENFFGSTTLGTSIRVVEWMYKEEVHNILMRFSMAPDAKLI